MNEQRNIKNQDQILKYNPVFVLLRFLYISRPFECGNIIISEISVLRATQEMEKKKKANRKSWRDVLCKRRNPMDVLRPRTFVETVFLCNGMAFFLSNLISDKVITSSWPLKTHFFGLKALDMIADG